MWVEILCGLVVYKLFRRLIFGNDGAGVPNVDSRHSDASFAVANRLEKIYGGKAYVGLRIPDADSGSRQSIDVVVLTKSEMMVVSVRNIIGFVEVGSDGNWVCSSDKHKVEIYADPVVETNRQIEILEAYLEQRGVVPPKGFLIGRVVLPNPKCRVTQSLDIMSEVISFDKWSQLRVETRSGFSSWVKDAFGGGKQDGPYKKLHSVLSTSPTWDRLELKGDRNILGEFVEFKGKLEDLQALRNIKRSKVGYLTVQKSSAFGGLGISKIHILYAPRDYRTEGSSASEWQEITVRSNVEVLFLQTNSKKAQKFKLSNIISMSLSA